MARLKNRRGWMQVVWNNRTGEEKSKMVVIDGTRIPYNPETIQIVSEEWLPKFEAELTLDLVQENANSLEYYIEGLVEYATHVEKKSSNTTRKYVGIYANWIKPFFKKKPANQITVKIVKDWVIWQLNKGIEAKTINNHITVLSRILQGAVEDGKLMVNPAKIIDRVEVKKAEKKKIFPYHAYEAKKLLDTAEGQVRNFIACGLMTGARTGELLRFNWQNFDWKTRELYINEGAEGDEGELKNAYSERTITLPETLIPYLEEQYKLTGENNGYMFLTYLGKPYGSMNSMAEQFHKVAEKAKVKKRRPYEMRHTFATNMIKSNMMTVYEVAEYLGHASIEMVIKKYLKFLEHNKEWDKEIGWTDLLSAPNNKSKPGTFPGTKRYLSEASA